jgi:hypothetical protein
MIHLKQSLIVLTLLLSVSLIHANTIRVPQDYAAIQEAIDHSQHGDTVLVAPGTYYENINFKGKNIIVASNFVLDGNSDQIKNTIIDGSRPVNPDTSSVVTFSSGEDSTAVIVGFTITGGGGTRYFYPNNFLCREGGGVYIESSSPTVKNNLITNNNLYSSGGVSELGGGGIRSNLGYPHIINNIITGNSAQYGAAFVIDNSAFDMGYLNKSGGEILNNLIYDNYGATKYGGGGALWISFPSHFPVLIENNTIVNNSAVGAGGVFVVSSTVTLKNNIIWGNTASQISLSNSFGQSVINVLNNDIQWGYQGQGGGVGNLDTYPLFKNAYLLADGCPCIDTGDPDTQYNDCEDPAHLGSALSPSRGGLRNDMGVYGGSHAWSGMIAFFPSAYAYFTSPANQMIFQYPDTIIHISAEVVNLDNISSVEFYSNNKKIAELHAPPFNYVWASDTMGEIALTMRAIGANDTIQSLFPVKIGIVKANYKVAASSYEFFLYGPWNAVDGKTTTRWSSQFSDPQWICVDLGTITSVNGVTLTWAAYGKAYQIQVSTDSLSWDTVYSTSSGKSGKAVISFEPSAARYVRMYGTQRGTVYGYSLFEFQIQFDQTDVSSETNVLQLPNRFELNQNYPNPFNPNTTIRYALPTTSRIRLRIFNVLGQVVADLVSAEQPAGWNQVVWNAKISSGIYFYRIEAVSIGDPSKRFVKTKKMIMLK